MPFASFLELDSTLVRQYRGKLEQRSIQVRVGKAFEGRSSE
jgi:hypothetical protein